MMVATAERISQTSVLCVVAAAAAAAAAAAVVVLVVVVCLILQRSASDTSQFDPAFTKGSPKYLMSERQSSTPSTSELFAVS